MTFTYMGSERKRTALSAGIIIRDILANSETVGTDKIYPVVSDNATTPYIVYRRISAQSVPTRAASGADAVTVEILCMDPDYSGSVELAEAVRAALEYAELERGGLTMRGCMLEDSEELWQDDTFIQRLIFRVRIN